MAKETEIVEVENQEEPEVQETPEEKPEESKTVPQEQFSGLLREKRAEASARQQAQADAAATRETNEQLRKELEEAKKPQPTELSEEDAAEPITRGEDLRNRNKLIKDIGDMVATKIEQGRATTLVERRSANAQALTKTHTVEAMGEGLDANTVVNEGAAWLQANKPHLFKAAIQGGDSASELYDLAITYVPEIKKRFQAHQNAILANKLDTSSDTPPSGGGPAGEAADLLHTLMTSSPAEIEKLLELNP